jgi:hypothetical protein
MTPFNSPDNPVVCFIINQLKRLAYKIKIINVPVK